MSAALDALRGAERGAEVALDAAIVAMEVLVAKRATISEILDEARKSGATEQAVGDLATRLHLTDEGLARHLFPPLSGSAFGKLLHLYARKYVSPYRQT